MDVGLSVSRVGGKAQLAALRKVSGRLRLDYSQFLELEMFTRFGGLMDARIKAQVVRGERIRALITQPRFTPLRAIDEIALLAALAEGVFDTLPANVIARVRGRLAAHLDANGGPAASAALAACGSLEAATLVTVVAAVRDLASQVGSASATQGGLP